MRLPKPYIMVISLEPLRHWPPSASLLRFLADSISNSVTVEVRIAEYFRYFVSAFIFSQVETLILRHQTQISTSSGVSPQRSLSSPRFRQLETWSDLKKAPKPPPPLGCPVDLATTSFLDFYGVFHRERIVARPRQPTQITLVDSIFT